MVLAYCVALGGAVALTAGAQRVCNTAIDGRLFPGASSQPRSAALAEPLEATADRQARFVRLLPSAGVRPRLCVVYLHGNAQTVDDVRPLLHALHGALRGGALVVGLEYPGYGQWAGAPRSEAAAHRALFSLLRALRSADSGVAALPLILVGRSIGAALALAAASAACPQSGGTGWGQPAGVVLISAFLSAREMASRLVGSAAGALVPSARLNNAAAVRTLRCPLLVVHGRADSLVPVGDAHALVAQALAGGVPAVGLSVVDGGHDDLDWLQALSDIRDFCRKGT